MESVYIITIGEIGATGVTIVGVFRTREEAESEAKFLNERAGYTEPDDPEDMEYDISYQVDEYYFESVKSRF